MKISIQSPHGEPLIDRGHVVSMVIKSFKGRRDVEVHLFRESWDPEEEEIYDWKDILGPPLTDNSDDEGSTRRMVLETFTEAERDQIVEFLKSQYADRLLSITASPIIFPVPRGLSALSDMSEGKDIGFIRFSKIPSFSLNLPLAGLYDLARHEPMADPDEQ